MCSSHGLPFYAAGGGGAAGTMMAAAGAGGAVSSPQQVLHASSGYGTFRLMPIHLLLQRATALTCIGPSLSQHWPPAAGLSCCG